MTVFVIHGFQGTHTLRQTDAFIQCFGDFLMILAISWGIFDAFSIEQGNAAPLFQQRHEMGFLANRLGAPTFGLDGFAMGKELVKDADLLGIITGTHCVLTEMGSEVLVTVQNLFHLYRVIGQ